MNRIYYPTLLLLGLLMFTTAAGGSAGDTAQQSNVLAVIGGSHIDRRHIDSFFSDEADILETITVETSAGTSPPILRMQHDGVPFYYVKFHGFSDVAASDMKGHNFVTMFAAFDQLGVTHIIAGATAGGLQPEFRKGDLILSNDLINLNFERPSNILAEANIQRPGIRATFNPPVCPDIHRVLSDLALEGYKAGRVFTGGVVVQDDAVAMRRQQKFACTRPSAGDIITHNVVTEMISAR
ncbi:uncharacterized protein METZ01_LOCUS415661, partial [marine metagenome]